MRKILYLLYLLLMGGLVLAVGAGVFLWYRQQIER